MKDFDFSKIFDSMKKNDISELIIKDGGKLYEIRRGGFKQNFVSGGVQPVVQQANHLSTQPVVSHQSAETHQSVSPQHSTENQAKEKESTYYEIKSPLVGTYYSSPKPDSPAFVEVGTKVTKGQSLCIVEAMKTFNEIDSDVDGVIKEICVKNGDLVEFGKVLFRIEL